MKSPIGIYPVNITFYRSETTQVENDFAAGRPRHDDLRYLDGMMRPSSRRASFEPRLHQGASWPSQAGFGIVSRLWLLRGRAAQGEFQAPSARSEEKLLHAMPLAAALIPVSSTINPT